MYRQSRTTLYSNSVLLLLNLAIFAESCTQQVQKPTHYSSISSINGNKLEEKGLAGDTTSESLNGPANAAADTAKQPGTGGEDPSTSSSIPAGTKPTEEKPAVLDPATATSGQIELANTKFAGQEAKLTALVKFAGITSPSLKMTTASGTALLAVSTLASDKTGTLVVEIYEGPKLRFVARRANMKFEKGKANSLKFADCSIAKVPWDGSDNETTCGWTIQNSK